MASDSHRRSLLLLGGIALLISSGLMGCNGGEDNSPSMGAVPPKPNPNMSANLPPEVRAQLGQAQIGGDAAKMSALKKKG